MSAYFVIRAIHIIGAVMMFVALGVELAVLRGLASARTIDQLRSVLGVVRVNVAFAGDDVFVSASVDHFAAQGAIYRRRVDGHDVLVAVGGGLPACTDGIIDTGCIATRGSAVALADRKGNLYVSVDTGHSWTRQASRLPFPSSVLIV